MINDLFGDNDFEERKKIVLMDFSAISNATFHICRNDPHLQTEEDLLNFWRHTLLSSILSRKQKIQPDEIVLCLDRGSWRKGVYKYYKAKRRQEKAKSDIDYEFFYKASDLFIEQIKENFPWLIVSERHAEGDDVIAILAHHLHKDHDVVILTSDKDMKQLLKLPNVKYYSYRDDEYQTVDNPHEFLLRQILGGDKNDGVPNVKSQDNCFIDENGRQKQCGPTLIDKILIQGVDEWIEEEELEDNYKRNRTMIELSEQTIPKDIWDSVVEQYIKYERNIPDFVKIATFLHKYKLKVLQENIDQFFC